MAYIKIEANNRNSSELRSNIDRLKNEIARLQSIADKVNQIFAEGGSAAVEEEYSLEPGEGDDLNTLLTSAAGEVPGPFVQQLLSRCG